MNNSQFEKRRRHSQKSLHCFYFFQIFSSVLVSIIFEEHYSFAGWIHFRIKSLRLNAIREKNNFKPITARCLLLRSDTVCLMREVTTQKKINCIIMHKHERNPNGSKDFVINNDLMGIPKMRSCQKQVLIAASFLVAVGMPKQKHREKLKIFMTNEVQRMGRINKHFRP